MERRAILEHFETPVSGRADVIVLGGGVAGVAAALAARRMGADVLLIEKGVALGGLATVGLISFYEPLCDGKGEKLIGGIAEELLRLAIEHGPDTLPDIWRGIPETSNGAPGPDKFDRARGRLASYYSPTIFSMALDELLVREGVRIRLDTLCARPVVEDGRVECVVAESKSGREAFSASAFVDATGDADVLFRAGAPCVEGQNWLTYIAHGFALSDLGAALSEGDALRARRWLASGSDLRGNGHPEGYPRFSGVRADEVTRFVMDGRKLLFDRVKQQDRRSRDVSALPSMAQFRTSRRLDGAYLLTESDECVAHADSVGLIGDFEKPGAWYEIPRGFLYCDSVQNLFAAGRIVSCEGGRAWEAARVIPRRR